MPPPASPRNEATRPWSAARSRTRLLALACALALAGCADTDHKVVISVPEQRMVLLKDGIPLAIYPVSTSRFGLGDQPGTRQTPTGVLEVASKIGEGAPLGEVFKSRSATGEIVRADSPGRDPIVTRILWLRGLESRNQNAYERFIYIHGTPEERNIGRPASYGCVRMRSCDVVRLFDEIGIGARVYILNEPLVAAAAPHIVPEAIIPPMPTPLPAPAMAYGAPANGQAQVAVSVTAPSR